MKLLWNAGVSIFLGLALSQAQAQSMSDKAFVDKAAQGGLMEVQLGNLAQQRAQDQQVKDFGKRMAQDHSKANDQLKSIADQAGYQLPQQLGAEEQQIVQKLSQLSGSDFDRAYMQTMVDDHQNDVSLFQTEATQANNPAIRQFAQNTTPKLREHLQLAQQIEQQVGG